MFIFTPRKMKLKRYFATQKMSVYTEHDNVFVFYLSFHLITTNVPKNISKYFHANKNIPLLINLIHIPITLLIAIMADINSLHLFVLSNTNCLFICFLRLMSNLCININVVIKLFYYTSLYVSSMVIL